MRAIIISIPLSDPCVRYKILRSRILERKCKGSTHEFAGLALDDYRRRGGVSAALHFMHARSQLGNLRTDIT